MEWAPERNMVATFTSSLELLIVEQNLRIVNEMEKLMRVVFMIGVSTIVFKSL